MVFDDRERKGIEVPSEVSAPQDNDDFAFNYAKSQYDFYAFAAISECGCKQTAT
jgi:hypothetical protein